MRTIADTHSVVAYHNKHRSLPFWGTNTDDLEWPCNPK